MLILAIAACDSPEPEPVALTALAAASLTDALPAVAEAWKARGGVDVTFSFDGSSKLARQIEAGAPADLLFSADEDTMDELERQGLLAPGTRRDLVGNTLVLVVPTGRAAPTSAADLTEVRHLALAGESVPAGRYARAALTAAGVWTQVEPKVVTGDNVRTTLAWVSRGEADAGVVYATDARADPGVTVAFAFPAESHPPIAYPAAVVRRSDHAAEAAAFLAFCASPEATAMFASAGFGPPPSR